MIILSAPVPFLFLWTFNFEYGTWNWNLDFGLGFGTGLGLDNFSRLFLLQARGCNTTAMTLRLNNSSFIGDEVVDCSVCNNSLCWDDEDFRQYVYYTQVTQTSERAQCFSHFCSQVTVFEVLIILVNTFLVICGIGGNILVRLSSIKD